MREEGGGRGKRKGSNAQEEMAQQVIIMIELSPLLEHWIPAKEVEVKKQLEVVEKLHAVKLVWVVTLQAKLLRSRWLMTLLDILQEWGNTRLNCDKTEKVKACHNSLSKKQRNERKCHYPSSVPSHP